MNNKLIFNYAAFGFSRGGDIKIVRLREKQKFFSLFTHLMRCDVDLHFFFPLRTSTLLRAVILCNNQNSASVRWFNQKR